jgi:hypothetical protein
MWRWTGIDTELYHYGVLGMKWGVHRAKVYQAKSNRARSRGNIGDAERYQNKSNRMMEKNERLSGGKNAFERASKQSMGKTLAQAAVFGTYGATKYNQARAKHASRGKAAVQATLYNAGNKMTGGLLGVVEPRLSNRNRAGNTVAKQSAQKPSKSGKIAKVTEK